MQDKLTPFDDPDAVAFPEPHEIEAHAMAFARMMFEHAAFEREVRELQDAIMREHGFGERRGNQWSARERPDRMVKLIEQRHGQLPETESIKKLLDDAIEPSDQRNLLAHGTWWFYNRRTSGHQRSRHNAVGKCQRAARESRLHRRRHQGTGRPVRGFGR
jgi:hypothetical protein